ncbi:MAG: Cyclopropane-fatty-acyl-phospholipid synthase, partial [Frankiales bacterium]|nr:Cyclopropane-fatty-acyl-phospholipid synthase [Frankiales bacterium]
LVRINWFTPYLLGYGLALPLSLIMPAGTALKLLMTLAYVAFVALCIKLRRHFNGDPRLDLLFIPSFFGLAWHWGFVTFLVTSPVVLAFVLLASYYSRTPTVRSAFAVVMLGMLMLVSHGLGFLLGWATGALMLLTEQFHRRRLWLPPWLPYAFLACASLGYFIIGQAFEAQLPAQPDSEPVWRGYEWKRLIRVPLYTVAATKEDVFLLPLALLLFAAPFIMGLRMRRGNWRAIVPLTVVVFLMLTLPSTALDTSFLYERFGLFLLPGWAWAFAADDPSRASETPRWRVTLGVLSMVACCGLLLFHEGARIWLFGKETHAVDAALRKLQPGARILALPFDITNPEARFRFAHSHYAAWYQAEAHGFVDFNFAWFRPQIVRFKPDRASHVSLGFDFAPQTFDWSWHEGWRYRYVLVSGAMPPGVFDGAPCPPVTLFSDSTFTILEYQSRLPSSTSDSGTTTTCSSGHR